MDFEFEELELGEEKIRIEKQTRKLFQKVIDHYTLKHLEKLSKKLGIREIYGSIGEGKESVVFLAKSDKDYFAVKVYRIETFPIKKLRMYIEGDPRFDVPENRNRFVFTWVRKEFANLRRSYEHGVLVPKPVEYEHNVLVTGLIGEEGRPAPKLLEVRLEQPEQFFQLVLDNYKRLYQRAKLVHADLSEYNILVHEQLPYFIDLSQAVLRTHPLAEQWLQRDLENIVNYFTSEYRLNIDLDKVIEEVKGECT